MFLITVDVLPPLKIITLEIFTFNTQCEFAMDCISYTALFFTFISSSISSLYLTLSVLTHFSHTWKPQTNFPDNINRYNKKSIIMH